MKTYIVLCKCAAGSTSVYNVKIKAESAQWEPLTATEITITFNAGGKIVGQFLSSEIYGFVQADSLA
jgi:hypothetical protein